ncbi:OPT superfamily oligopeptide transporter [Linnemannia elongata AG-77]|uniref:OPT superfamily oligopeptide transporter n=1 Tax=Linnemannia elongata AG-77 TaxID=1314771 RepID=A0A197JM35_9FUNG|nr:OPT superfamily oligopeptide transporter [Linnemannia elongata AG-77]
MAISLPLSRHGKESTIKLQEDVHSLKGRPSNVSQDTRGSFIGASAAGDATKKGDITRTGRSVHSVCSVDTVSQQISARHHQHSRLTTLSNVGSLHSQCQALHSNCETAAGSGSGGCAAIPGGPGIGVGLGGGAGSSAYQSATGAILENSPIQVVRATVGTIDDSSLPCFTFRMWTLSTVFVVMGAAIAEYNFFRSNSAYFSIYFVQLASYFCGKVMARCLPTREFELTIPGLNWLLNRRLQGGASSRRISWRFTLNPGKFNMKEHMLIGVAAAAGCSPAYATNVLAIQDLVFALPLGSLTGIGLVVSSQLIGFSMAWLLFDYVIKPSVMIWPATLVNVSLYNTLHEHKVLTRWFTRMQLFWYAFFAVFIYQWLPRMFMPVLTSMALLCWINPSNNVLRKLGSGYMGLGMGCISLDWSIISGVGPLFTPWWAQCNFFVGLILMLWIITPVVYFSNYWSAMSYPIVSSNLFDNSSELYDVSQIVNKDLSFNITMYESYSPIIMTPYFAITYGTSFMAVIATLVHVSLYYGSDIWLIAKTRFTRKYDRIQALPFIQSLKVLFDKGSQHESGQETSHSRTTGHASTDLGHAYIGLEGSPLGGTRSSESMSFRNEVVDGGAGMGGISGLGSVDERKSFSRSSHYRQQSQQCQHQDTFLSSELGQSNGCPSRQRTKHYVDDRDQIPTEMFGTEDIHTSLMRAYPEIPGWWFGTLFVICFTVAVFVCITSDIHLPVYALILALVLAAVFAIPMAIIQALSSSQVGLNVLSEVICGYLLPGNQLGNSVFKCYSYMALYQCLNLTQAFKLGHYMKVPPRKIFITVIYGTLVGAFVNLQVLDWVLHYNRDALFDTNPQSGWSFRNLDLFFSASLLWGAISPKLLFEQGSIYQFLPYCFLIGVFIPIPVWNNRLRRVPWHLINTPLICVGASFVPQAPASFVTSAGIVAFIFAFLVLRFRHEWWRRYTFVLAAALDAGTQICNMAIFVVFSLILKGAVEFPDWLGNDAVNPEKCGVGDGYN